MTTGAGSTPFGSGPYGTGTPTTTPVATGRVLEDTSNAQQGSRFIDPRTKDYVLNADGRFVGQQNTRHLVVHRLSTVLGSSATLAVGHTLGQVERMTQIKSIDTRIRAALSDIEDQMTIESIDISTARSDIAPGRAFIVVKWRDLATNETFEEKTA